MPQPGFAVIDLETTGFGAGRNDRIVEIAVVRVSPQGEIEDRMETLVNPDRDLGPTHIHGIRGRDVMHAPSFEDVSDELADALEGRLLVAHNAAFDTRFLGHEWHRAGVLPDPALPHPHLCTMQLARELLPGTGRSLYDCCSAFDIEIGHAHRASADALATAELLAELLRTDGDASRWTGALERAAQVPPVRRLGRRAPWVARDGAGAAPGQPAPVSTGHESGLAARIEAIVDELAPIEGTSTEQDYLALLDACVADRHLSLQEADSLREMAEQLGIDVGRRRELHQRYFETVVERAWEDAVLSPAEVADLASLARILDIEQDQLNEGLRPRPLGRRVVTADAETPADIANAQAPAANAVDGSSSEAAQVEPTANDLRIGPGDLVVFTGSMLRSRDEWIVHVERHGLKAHPAVTKKVACVVAADPDSLSGKAKKARSYGIPIVSEDWLEARIRELSES